MAAIPKLVLYGSPRTCSMVPRILLRELHITHEFFEIAWSSDGNAAKDGSFSAEDYLKLHHSGLVPLLTVDGRSLTETPAILHYIALQSPRAHDLLGGEGSLAQAEVASWTTWLSGTLHSYGGGFGLFFRPAKFADDKEQQYLVQVKGHALIEKCFRRLEEHLADRLYIVGEKETIADYYCLVFWYWGYEHKFGMEAKYPNYSKLVARMEKKESVRWVLEREAVKTSPPRNAWVEVDQ